MKMLIVGGFWDDETPKPSKLLQSLHIAPTQLALQYADIKVANGGNLNELIIVAKEAQSYDLVFWMPNIKNIHENIFPIKKKGGVMIVSKVLREDRTRADAVQRIFKFHANAVIAVNKTTEPYRFELIDALNNTWAEGDTIECMIYAAQSLTEWTNESVREETSYVEDELDRLIRLNKVVADKVREKQERFFGNISTRCMLLFPSYNYGNGQYMLVSARNTNKQELNRTDMVVVCRDTDNKLKYLGDRKPSVDSPVQVELYAKLPHIKFMIHGHNQVIGAPTTEHYCPCGDKREVDDVMKLMQGSTTSKVINLKNHGFLMMATSLDELERLVNEVRFVTLE